MSLLEEHLEDCGFDKYFEKLKKRIDGKSVIVYGTGLLFETVLEQYDLSSINIIGVSDIKYLPQQEGEIDFGYKIIPLESITHYNADIILVGTKYYHRIIEELKEDLDFDKKTKILPLVKIPFFKKIKDLFLD